MRFFNDTEFYENGTTVVPLSLAIVAEDARELYIEFNVSKADADAILSAPDPFVRENVLPHLEGTHRVSRDMARAMVEDFVRPSAGDDLPEFWAYYASYDWIVICQLFGRMVDLPKWMPMHPISSSGGSNWVDQDPPNQRPIPRTTHWPMLGGTTHSGRIWPHTPSRTLRSRSSDVNRRGQKEVRLCKKQ